MSENDKNEGHKNHKEENCGGGLLPASNINDCYVCIKCGYVWNDGTISYQPIEATDNNRLAQEEMGVRRRKNE